MKQNNINDNPQSFGLYRLKEILKWNAALIITKGLAKRGDKSRNYLSMSRGNTKWKAPAKVESNR